jgi:hypothetical protein
LSSIKNSIDTSGGLSGDARDSAGQAGLHDSSPIIIKQSPAGQTTVERQLPTPKRHSLFACSMISVLQRMPAGDSIENLKDRVRSFWEPEPCGARDLPSPDAYEQQALSRYAFEPHIKDFAKFAAS